MRAKRSKKYRKTMSTYQQAFSFRPPYQVLLDSHFLRTCHSFHMPLQKYLDNTLHDQSRLFITQCTLAKITKEYEKDKIRRGDKRLGGRPEWLPHPTEMPLRYCKHKDEEGNELEAGALSEERCLLDLVSGQVKGGQEVKNKQHFVVATADRFEGHEKEDGKKRYPTSSAGGVQLRERIRQVPGVPIVYVKRSVMILEELSGASEAVRRQGEREKIKEGLGLGNDRKRKRGEDEEDVEDGGNLMLRDLMQEDRVQMPTARGMARPKQPNPLSVKKKKQVKIDSAATQDVDESKKKPSRRVRGKKKKAGVDVDTAPSAPVAGKAD